MRRSAIFASAALLVLAVAACGSTTTEPAPSGHAEWRYGGDEGPIAAAERPADRSLLARPNLGTG